MSVGKDSQSKIMAWSLGIALVLLGIKVVAAVLTRSSAIYSDAAESVAHAIAVGFAWWSLRLAHKPADRSHLYGHDRIAFVSSGFEGSMITAAAVLIIQQALWQWSSGAEIRHLAVGAILTGVVAVINLVLGLAILRTARRTHSPLLEANGQHVLTDVWTSAAVVLAIGLVWLTGWHGWDPLIAILAALNIGRTGISLIRKGLTGLLDEADQTILSSIEKTLAAETNERGIRYHDLRYRHSGHTHWVEFHLVFLDTMSVGNAHDIATEVEAAVAALLQPDGRVISHLEPRAAEHESQPWEIP